MYMHGLLFSVATFIGILQYLTTYNNETQEKRENKEDYQAKANPAHITAAPTTPAAVTPVRKCEVTWP